MTRRKKCRERRDEKVLVFLLFFMGEVYYPPMIENKKKDLDRYLSSFPFMPWALQETIIKT